MRKVSRAIVVLKEPSTRRQLAEYARPSVNLERIIEEAYWRAWDQRSDCVYITLKHSMTKDGEAKHFILPLPWFDVVEGRDDA